MKILVLGTFNEFALEHYYLNGLKRAGADCSYFDIAHDYDTAIETSLLNKFINRLSPSLLFEPCNKKLLQFIGNKQFDAILVFKGMTLYPATLEKLKSHTKLLCCYNPDHPFKFYSTGSGNKNIVNSIDHYDIYFTYAQKIAEQLKQGWKTEAHVIPFGYDDVPQLNAGMGGNPYTQQNLFIGAWDKERMDWLLKIHSVGIVVYGDPNWAKLSNQNRSTNISYGGKPKYGMEYKMALQNAGTIINLLRRQNMEEDSHNMRTFEVPGYGGLLVSNRTKEQSQFFEEDKEAVYFDEVGELNDKLAFLSKNESVANNIKQAAKTRSEKSGYGYSSRSKEMFEIMLKHL
ncbi:MAG: glycosyltransferase [Bacteroidetes bacterium]|nr:glycosyltransferase [Bacteroidota bacterium]